MNVCASHIFWTFCDQSQHIGMLLPVSQQAHLHGMEMGGGLLDHFVRPSICSSVHIFDRVCSIFPELLLSISWTAQPFLIFFIKLGMVMHYHEVMCRVEKLVLYLQCQGNSEHSYNQNMTIFYYIC